MSEENDISTRRSKLSRAQQALLEMRLRGGARNSTETQIIPRCSREMPLSLSFAQLRIWFLNQLQPDTPIYNIPAAAHLRGPLNVAALELSLNEIVRRHEAWRTTFPAVNGEPVQVIAPTLTLSLLVKSVCDYPEAEREAVALRMAAEEARQPFDLAEGPLVRPILLQLGSEDHILLLIIHHIVFDHWSAWVLVREVAGLYEAFVTGGPSPLPEPRIQYADFAHWQHQLLRGAALEAQLDYWRRQLRDLPLQQLPSDRPRSAVLTFQGAKRALRLPQTLTNALKDLSRRRKVSLFMLLLAAFKTLLYRYTGQLDVVVGSPITNRKSRETEDLIGLFTNTLVMRTDLSNNPSFLELLGRVREVALAAYAHQDVPFEKLVEELQPQRDSSRNPLFQAMFVLQSAPWPALELPGLGLTLTHLEIDSKTSKFDLTLAMEDSEQELAGVVEYSTDLFDEETIDRMLRSFQTLLEGIVKDPAHCIATLPLLTSAERNQQLVEWNDTKAAYPRDRCIHHLFEAQAERTPGAIAVAAQGQELTYRELNEQANCLAHRLRQLGVGPSVVVAVCMERTPQMVVSLLGILKAGGAYFALDPDDPTERLAYMLEDSQAPVLVTSERLVATLPQHRAQVITLGAAMEDAFLKGNENPSSGATPNDLAYVIYTSGSTGNPKGVEIQHAGLVNIVTWHQRAYDVTPADRAMQLARWTFDAAGWDLWPHITAGASVHIADDECRTSPPKLLKWLAAKSISICFLPTPLLEAVLEEQLPPGLALRYVLTGGDVLRRRPPNTLPFHVVNHYGPTECTIVTTGAPLSSESNARPSIGRPLSNTHVYLLDPNLQLVPVGVAGEICIGGVGLARGYLNRPELTAEKFIAHPFSDRLGERLYRTGDLARYLRDGNIDFLGRNDRQVQIRGCRIELGEIEAVLAQHPAIQQAIVVADQGTFGDKALVAYFVPTQGLPPTGTELRNYLRKKLPAHMIPSAFVLLDAFPLGPNGKVDYTALPTPSKARANPQKSFSPPRTHNEKVLARIWSEVLGVEQVGVHDTFFELGGHSLLVTQLASRASDVMQIEIPLRVIFAAPTVAELAEVVEEIRRSGIAPVLAATAVTDLNAETVLDPEIQSGGLSFDHRSEPASVLLTGATGFLGSFLLHELLQQTNADIYCLVRSSDAQASRQRIQKSLDSYSLSSGSLDSRIIPVEGDLSQPLLGIPRQQFDALASTVDAIYHNGAHVNFVYPYGALKDVNVRGTQEILRLACRAKLSVVHFVSTLSVFDSIRSFNKKLLREDDRLEHGEDLITGYAQSKWVAEHLLITARSRGVPVCIYRPGAITGHSQTGINNTDDLLCNMIKSCIALRLAPKLDAMPNMVPVDFVSKAIVHLSRKKESLGKVFHLINNHPVHLSTLVEWVRAQGFHIQEVPSDKWQAELENLASRSMGSALHAFMSIFKRLSEEGLSISDTYFQDHMPQFDCQNTIDGLADAPIICPPIDAALLRTYFSYFTRSGFLKTK